MDKFEICPAAENIYECFSHQKESWAIGQITSEDQCSPLHCYGSDKNTINKASCREIRQFKLHCYLLTVFWTRLDYVRLFFVSHYFVQNIKILFFFLRGKPWPAPQYVFSVPMPSVPYK